MSHPIHTLVVGRDRSRFGVSLDLLFVATLTVATLLAYAVGVFAVGGGVVFLPGDAVLVGLVGAAVLATRGSGLALSWLAVYGPLLAYGADHYLLGLSGRSLAEKVAAFLSPEGLVVLGVAALVVGTLGWAAGSLGRWAVASVRADVVDGDR